MRKLPIADPEIELFLENSWNLLDGEAGTRQTQTPTRCYRDVSRTSRVLERWSVHGRQAWAGPLETSGGGQGCLPPSPGRGEECTVLGEGLQAPLRRGRGCCTKPACVSPEWAALSQALVHGPGPACLGRQEVWPQPLGSRPTSWPLPAQAPHPPGGKGNESL